jgi:hypothetical protein
MMLQNGRKSRRLLAEQRGTLAEHQDVFACPCVPLTVRFSPVSSAAEVGVQTVAPGPGQHRGKAAAHVIVLDATGS